MTRTQTALYEWTAPDGTPRYLIDPAEWQDKQRWGSWPSSAMQRTDNCGPLLDDGPVWVRELLPIPEPLPEVHWIDGHPVAMLPKLPIDTTIRPAIDEPIWVVNAACNGWPRPVIVVSWPDGSKPERPTVQPKCGCPSAGRIHVSGCTNGGPPTVDGAR